MDFYTGKPDRPIEHYGIVSHTLQTQYGIGFMEGLLSGESVVEQQSDQEALQKIVEFSVRGKT